MAQVYSNSLNVKILNNIVVVAQTSAVIHLVAARKWMYVSTASLLTFFSLFSERGCQQVALWRVGGCSQTLPTSGAAKLLRHSPRTGLERSHLRRPRLSRPESPGRIQGWSFFTLLTEGVTKTKYTFI